MICLIHWPRAPRTVHFRLIAWIVSSKQAALLDAGTMTWTVLTTSSGYTGKFDSNNEEGWTLTPGFNGGILTVDTHAGTIGNASTHSETYNPTAGTWTSAGSTVVQLWDSRN